MHPASLRCHLLHLQYEYLNPAAPRHLQASGISHTLPCSPVQLRFCQMPAADCSGPRQLSPCPTLWVFGQCMPWGPSGKEGLNLQHSPPYLPPSLQRCCWRLLQGCRPARLLLKGRRNPRHQLCTPFLLFFLSGLAPFPPEVRARLPGSPSRLPRAQRGR